jgi:hypothetical protein
MSVIGPHDVGLLGYTGMYLHFFFAYLSPSGRIFLARLQFSWHAQSLASSILPSSLHLSVSDKRAQRNLSKQES